MSISINNFYAWLQNKILGASAFGIKPFSSELEFKLQESALTPNYSLYILNNDLTPMDYVVSVLNIKFHFAWEQATALMLEIHENGSAEIIRGSSEPLNEVAQLLESESAQIGFMLKCNVMRLQS